MYRSYSVFYKKMDYIQIILVSTVSYILITRFLKKLAFFSFDFFWRIATILVVYYLFSNSINLSSHQVLMLVIIIGINFVACMLFSPLKSFYYHAIGVFFAPVMEEMLFRGLVFSAIEGSFEKKILFSSIFFSLYHLKNIFVLSPFALLYQMTYAFIFGIPVSLIAYHTGSLFLPIAIHSINNMFAATISRRLYPKIFEHSD